MKSKFLTLFLFSISICFGQVDLPVDFESTTAVYFTDFGGNTSSIVADPTNSNNSVAQTIKTSSAEPWAGTVIGDPGFLSPIPFSGSATTISLRVFSEYPGVAVHMKSEDLLDPSIAVETRMYTTLTNEWETLVFDFSNPIFGSAPLNINLEYQKLIVFFDFGILGATVGDRTFYWDDVMMGGVSNSLTQIDLPVTFEDPSVSYALVDFENNSSTIGADPTNASETVAITTKPADTSPWSGTVIGTRNGFANPIPFSQTATTIKMRVYSPDVNTPILLKTEVASDPTLSVETLQYTTTANEWEEIEWDFLQHLPNTPAMNFNLDYNLLAVFFNFGVEGSAVGDKTYYWDDVVFPFMTSNKEIPNIELTVFPNPVKDKLQIDIEGDILELQLVNVLGQTVVHEVLHDARNRFDVSALAAGTYFLVVRTEEGRGSFLLVKE